MAFLEYGTAKGAAYKIDYGQHFGQELALESALRQKKIDTQTEAKLTADMFQYGRANNPYDNKLLQEYSDSLVREAGNYIRKNPNWRYSPDGWMYMNDIKNKMLNNEHILRSERFDQNVKAYQEAVIKNPELAGTTEYIQMRNEIMNYQETGSIDRSVNRKEFVFQMPNVNNIINDTIKVGSQLATEETAASLNGYPVTRIAVNEKTLYNTANALYSQRRTAYDLVWNELDDDQKTLYNNNPVEFVKQMLQSGKGIQYDQMKMYNAIARAGNAAGTPQQVLDSSYFNRDINKIPANGIKYSPYSSAISPVANNQLSIDKEGLFFAYRKPDGKVGWLNMKSMVGSQVSARNTGNVIKGPQGETFVEIAIPNVPMNDEMFSPGKDLLISDFNVGSFISDPEDAIENPKYKSLVQIVKDKDGKNTKNVNLKAYVRAQINDATVQDYERQAGGQAYANKVQNTGMNQLELNYELQQWQKQIATEYNDGDTLETDDGRKFTVSKAGGQVNLIPQ